MIGDIKSELNIYSGAIVDYFGEKAGKLKQLRMDIHFSQKISILAKACIELANQLYGMVKFDRLVKVLGSTFVSDFFEGIPTIHAWLKPINANSVHANALFNKVIAVYERDDVVSDENRTKIKDGVAQFLNDLGDKEKGYQFGYATSDQFLKVLHNRLDQILKIPEDKILGIKEVPLHSVSWGEWLTSNAFNFVSAATVVCYLREWNLLDTAKWAASIGSIPGFSWVNNLNFQFSFECAILTAFGLSLVESLRKASSGVITFFKNPDGTAIGEIARKNARWEAIASAAEAVFFSIGILSLLEVITKDPVIVALSLIAAKLIGGLKIIYRKHDLFDTQAPTDTPQPSLVSRVKASVSGFIGAIAEKIYIASLAERVMSAVRKIFDLLNDLIDLQKDGFDKLYKVLLPHFKLLDKFVLNAPLFEKCRETLEWHKDVIYAAKIFSVFPNWIRKVPDSNSWVISTPLHKWNNTKKCYELSLADPSTWVKTLYDFASVFETAKFLRKNAIYSFDYFVKVGSDLADKQIPLFGYAVKDIPLLKHISSSPKNIMIGLASFIDICAQLWKAIIKGDSKQFSVENLAHFVSNIGKMILVTWEATSSLGFNIVEIITGDAGLIKYWFTQYNKRSEFNNLAVV